MMRVVAIGTKDTANELMRRNWNARVLLRWLPPEQAVDAALAALDGETPNIPDRSEEE